MYTPTQGLFENGRIADAIEVMNELVAISSGMQENSAKIDSETILKLAEAKSYTDDSILAITVDGGTF